MVIIDAAKQIMTVLRSRKNLTDEEKEILGDLHVQLTTAIAVSKKEVDEIHKIEERLNVIQGKVMCWERYWPMIWDSGLDEATEYLNAADEARQMTKKLEILCLTEDREKEMLRRAKNLLQISMERLGEEFKHMLIKNRQPFDTKHVPVFSIADSAVSEISHDNKVVEDSKQRKIINRNAEEFTINLVRHDVIPELKRIANVMYISGYADECSVAYIGIQSSVLVENLRILEKEKLRTEDVLKLEQVSLKSKINRRIQTMKMLLRVYLASDKRLSEQIFGELGTVNLASFTEPLVVQLLKYFDEAISTGPKNPAKVFHLLDMYEVLAGLLPYLDSLYSDKAISQVIVDGEMVLRGLADSARKTLDEFEDSIMTYGMSETFAAEGIHPLTKYVMNYISALTGYHEILDSLLNDHCGEPPMPASSCTSPGVEEGSISGGTCDFSPIAQHFLSDNSILKWLSNGSSPSPSTKEESISGGTCKLSPMALQFRAFCCILEFQLYNKAKLFKDASLKHVFLMNNMHYMVQTVENSELQFILGEEWIREHNWEFQQHVMNCKSVTWSPVLSLTSNSENEFDDEGRLNVIQEKIMSWETDQSMHWDFGPNEANEYINSADELQKIIEKVEAMCLKDDGEKELLRRAHDVLQIAMARLVEEFKHMLIQKRQPFEPEHMYFRSSEDDAGSVISLGDESFKESQPRDSASRNSEEYIVDLVHPVMIPELRCIANLMFISGYGHECSQAYVSVRRDALDEFLLILEMEKLSMKDVLKLEWGSLKSKIRRWVRTMKIFVRVYLASEKCLFEQIFGDLGTTNLVSFTEASKASMLRLLNFGEAVSIGPHEPEKLFPILDMYEVLADLLPDIDSLYADEAGARVRINCREVLRRFGDSVRATFLKFENAISTSTSTNPIAGGGIHPLTRFVMVYLDALTGYRETLNFLLKDHDGEDAMPLSPYITPSTEEENTREGACDGSPLALHFISVASILECNLDDKARLYRDASLQHIFLMNNIHYMAQKVANSNLQSIFGDGWIRRHNWKFQQHEINYERTTWSSILAILKVEGDYSSIRTLLKESFRNFYIAFEKVYRTQTAWLIPNAHLREDLRISTSLKVIQAYRTFVGRYANLISVKQIKYSADDLQNYLLDLFEGSQRSIHNPHRR